MRQRREDIRNIALIVVSGCLGALAIGIGLDAATSVDRQERPGFVVEDVEKTLIVTGAKRGARHVSIQFVGPARQSDEVGKQLEEKLLEELDLHLEADGNRIVAADLVVTGIASASSGVRITGSMATTDGSRVRVDGPNVRVDGPHVRIRGSAANADGPIVYVDGVRFNRGLDGIEPDDIDSVEIVKGDRATEMYGPEARDGVIIVITKSGRKQKGGSR